VVEVVRRSLWFGAMSLVRPHMETYVCNHGCPCKKFGQSTARVRGAFPALAALPSWLSAFQRES
jgi:hypothetical protein